MSAKHRAEYLSKENERLQDQLARLQEINDRLWALTKRDIEKENNHE